MALFSSSFFAKCLRVGEDDPGWGHLCHTDTFLFSNKYPQHMFFVEKLENYMDTISYLELCISLIITFFQSELLYM